MTPDPTDEPGGGVVTADDDDDGLSAGAIAGIVIGALALLVLLICIVFLLFSMRRRRNNDSKNQQPAVYSSSDAAATPPPPPAPVVAPPKHPYAPDEARGILSPDDPLKAAAAAAAAAAATPRDDDDADGGLGAPAQPAVPTDPTIPAIVVPRGPTPPPHDYVLGAGPADTRSEFDDLHARFEREEIGDNSAVLGVDRTGLSPDVPVIAAPYDGTPVLPESFGNESVLPPPPAFPDSGAGPSVAPYAAPYDPGRGNVASLDTQDRLAAGADGSGLVSDVPPPMAYTPIAEEGADVPSLERDPVRLPRNPEPSI